MKHNVLHQLAIGLTLFVLSGFVCPTVTFSQIAGIDYIQKALEADERGDLSLATSYYHIAAEAGNVESQYMLGCRYLLGKGVAVDYAEGAKWIRKAAEQGYGSAQSSMGVCYESGMGVPQDNNEAIKWYRKAAAQGNVSAQESVKKLTGQAKSAGNSSKASASTQSKTNNSKENSKPTKGTAPRTFIGCKLRVSTISDVKAQLALRSLTPTVTKDGSLFFYFRNADHKKIDEIMPQFCGTWWQSAAFSFLNDGKLDQIRMMNTYSDIMYAEIYYDILRDYILEHYHFVSKSKSPLAKKNDYEELGHLFFNAGVTTYVLIYGYSSGNPFVSLKISHTD